MARNRIARFKDPSLGSPPRPRMASRMTRPSPSYPHEEVSPFSILLGDLVFDFLCFHHSDHHLRLRENRERPPGRVFPGGRFPEAFRLEPLPGAPSFRARPGEEHDIGRDGGGRSADRRVCWGVRNAHANPLHIGWRRLTRIRATLWRIKEEFPNSVGLRWNCPTRQGQDGYFRTNQLGLDRSLHCATASGREAKNSSTAISAPGHFGAL